MEEINIIKEMIKGMNDGARLYWLAVSVKYKELTEAEAGYILTQVLKEEGRL